MLLVTTVSAAKVTIVHNKFKKLESGKNIIGTVGSELTTKSKLQCSDRLVEHSTRSKLQCSDRLVEFTTRSKLQCSDSLVELTARSKLQFQAAPHSVNLSKCFPELPSSLKGALVMTNAMPISTREPDQGTASSSRKTVQTRTEKYSNPTKQVSSMKFASHLKVFIDLPCCKYRYLQKYCSVEEKCFLLRCYPNVLQEGKLPVIVKPSTFLLPPFGRYLLLLTTLNRSQYKYIVIDIFLFL